MTFDSIEKVCKEFDLSSSDPAGMKKELYNLIKEVHPDLNPDSADTPEKKQRIYRLTAALEFLNSYGSDGALVPVAQFTEIVKTMADSLVLSNQETADQRRQTEIQRREKEATEKFDHSSANQLNQVRVSGRVPRVSMSFLAGLASFVWFFPDALQRNATLNELVDVTNPFFTMAWLYVLVFTLMTWMSHSIRTNKEQQFLSSLNLERTQIDVFSRFLRSGAFDSSGSKSSFKRGQLRDYLLLDEQLNEKFWWREDISPSRAFQLPILEMYAKPKLDSEMAENLTDVILSKVEARGFVRRVDVPSLDEVYEILDEEWLDKT